MSVRESRAGARSATGHTRRRASLTNAHVPLILSALRTMKQTCNTADLRSWIRNASFVVVFALVNAGASLGGGGEAAGWVGRRYEALKPESLVRCQ